MDNEHALKAFAFFPDSVTVQGVVIKLYYKKANSVFNSTGRYYVKTGDDTK